MTEPEGETLNYRSGVVVKGETLNYRSGVVVEGFLDGILSCTVLQLSVPLD